jgi:hypothetical protein
MIGSRRKQKTARELADLIAARICVDGVFVSVQKDPIYGWYPTVTSARNVPGQYQVLADEIAAELRFECDLKA